mgnify:CR=1 FL=1
MKLLEAELGVTLFERGSRRIRLTPAGKTFYDRALAILDLSQAARTELTAQKQEIQGVVRLGIICAPYALCGMMDTMVGTLRGIGYSVMPMSSTLDAREVSCTS